MAAIAGSVSPAGRFTRHFVLLDKDESCLTADLSNIRPAQWTGELLNTTLFMHLSVTVTPPFFQSTLKHLFHKCFPP